MYIKWLLMICHSTARFHRCQQLISPWISQIAQDSHPECNRQSALIDLKKFKSFNVKLLLTILFTRTDSKKKMPNVCRPIKRGNMQLCFKNKWQWRKHKKINRFQLPTNCLINSNNTNNLNQGLSEVVNTHHNSKLTFLDHLLWWVSPKQWEDLQVTSNSSHKDQCMQWTNKSTLSPTHQWGNHLSLGTPLCPSSNLTKPQAVILTRRTMPTDQDHLIKEDIQMSRLTSLHRESFSSSKSNEASKRNIKCSSNSRWRWTKRRSERIRRTKNSMKGQMTRTLPSTCKANRLNSLQHRLSNKLRVLSLHHRHTSSIITRVNLPLQAKWWAKDLVL